MGYKINDEFYRRIREKVDDGTFTEGKCCGLTRYYFKGKTIEDFPLRERTPEVCASLMQYYECEFADVPVFSRTREFFIDCFTCSDVFSYIRSNINDFDRQFFKDLIATNDYAMHSDKNCFDIMPLEYIDEEMCSLAILNSLNWTNYRWFYSVAQRKPEVLTADLWKLGARLYSRFLTGQNKFLSITPEEYKDTEYYTQMCRCNFSSSIALHNGKGIITDSFPQEVLTPEFLLNLINDDVNNIACFNEKALETELVYVKYGIEMSKKVWQYAVSLDGDVIEYIGLNDERVDYFLKCYPKDSLEYKYAFKDKYKRYKKKKTNAEALKLTEQRTQNLISNAATMTFVGALAYSARGEDPSKAIDDVNNSIAAMQSSVLPINYRGIVPIELSKMYDSEEYLELLYKMMGIEIIDEYNTLFYNVNLPEGWTIERDGRWNYVKNNQDEVVITYFYDSKFYDMDAYVSVINVPEEEVFMGVKRILVKPDQNI